MKKTSKSIKDTEKIAKDFLKILCQKRAWLSAAASCEPRQPRLDVFGEAGFVREAPAKVCVVGLYGDLGAGKTTFTQALGKALGIKEAITSPTFVIMKTYKLKNLKTYKLKNLIHIDAYRLKKGEELLKLGWADIISDPKNLVLIEWPEQVADIMPEDHLKIKIKHLDENSREFEICS